MLVLMQVRKTPLFMDLTYALAIVINVLHLFQDENSFVRIVEGV